MILYEFEEWSYNVLIQNTIQLSVWYEGFDSKSILWHDNDLFSFIFSWNTIRKINKQAKMKKKNEEKNISLNRTCLKFRTCYLNKKNHERIPIIILQHWNVSVFFSFFLYSANSFVQMKRNIFPPIFNFIAFSTKEICCWNVILKFHVCGNLKTGWCVIKYFILY